MGHRDEENEIENSSTCSLKMFCPEHHDEDTYCICHE